MTRQYNPLVPSQFARHFGNYNHFKGSIKNILTNFKGVLMIIIYIFQLIYYEDITSMGKMIGRKGERRCKALWFYEMENMLFLQFYCD
jgi:hypothetical protein